MKIMNHKVGKGHSKKDCSRRLGKAMNGKELLCFCVLCICGNKETFKVNRKVIRALEQYFVMPSAPLIYHSSTPVSTSLSLHNLANCIMLLTLIEFVPYPDIFIQNVQSWGRGIFMRLLEKSDLLLKTFRTHSCTFFHY
jgi:hypothetical protein